MGIEREYNSKELHRKNLDSDENILYPAFGDDFISIPVLSEEIILYVNFQGNLKK